MDRPLPRPGEPDPCGEQVRQDRVVRGRTGDGDAQRLDESRLKRLLGYNVSRADIRLRQAFNAHFAPLQLRPAEFSALVLIDANARINQKQLGEALDMSAPNLAVLIDKLAQRRLVTRVRSDEDRRAQHLHLTTKGQTVLAKAEAVATQMELRILSQLTDGERAILVEILQKVATAPVAPNH